jgi:hypothetical protein
MDREAIIAIVEKYYSHTLDEDHVEILLSLDWSKPSAWLDFQAILALHPLYVSANPETIQGLIAMADELYGVQMSEATARSILELHEDTDKTTVELIDQFARNNIQWRQSHKKTRSKPTQI